MGRLHQREAVSVSENYSGLQVSRCRLTWLSLGHTFRGFFRDHWSGAVAGLLAPLASSLRSPEGALLPISSWDGRPCNAATFISGRDPEAAISLSFWFMFADLDSATSLGRGAEDDGRGGTPDDDGCGVLSAHPSAHSVGGRIGEKLGWVNMVAQVCSRWIMKLREGQKRSSSAPCLILMGKCIITTCGGKTVPLPHCMWAAISFLSKKDK